ncbi:MAG: Fe2+-dependent dioxygenase [Rhodospirillales bacterium]|nr:Fe2+-dependent dioxygenase [Rhodospirillales bacterium]
MMVRIPDVLTAEQVRRCREVMESAEWVDGAVTAGHQSVKTKNNMQLPEGSPAARELGDLIIDALSRNPLFIAAALPLKIFPPLFNRYRDGETFGLHVDNAVRPLRGTPYRIRSDLSATLFFADPTEYDGGELVVEDTYGTHTAKLPAGHMVLYPASSLHRVEPVTRGTRFASFFWIQSMVRDDGARSLLFALDMAIQDVARAMPDHASVVRLTNVYHNLVRRWADC